MMRIWCNGRWFEEDDFPASITDRGMMVGLGLFETILAVDGKPVFADKHLDRLANGCRRLGWHLEMRDPAGVMRDLIMANHLERGRCRIRLAITGGSGPVHDLTSGGDHLLWMLASPLPDVPLTGTALISPWLRNEHSALLGLKCASYAENVVALDHARRAGFDETLFLNTSGGLCEAATANVFLVINNVLVTPPLESGCLPGITRAIVLELAEQLGISCEQRRITKDELEYADELFLTSSIRGITGISRLAERMMNEAPGPITTRLHHAWQDLVRREIS